MVDGWKIRVDHCGGHCADGEKRDRRGEENIDARGVNDLNTRLMVVI